MRRKLIHVLCLLATQRHNRTQDALLVNNRQIGTRHNYLCKYESRVGRKRPDLRLAAATDARRDPVHRDHGNHNSLRLGILLEIYRVGNYVRLLVDRLAAVAPRVEDCGTIVLENG